MPSPRSGDGTGQKKADCAHGAAQDDHGTNHRDFGGIPHEVTTLPARMSKTEMDAAPCRLFNAGRGMMRASGFTMNAL